MIAKPAQPSLCPARVGERRPATTWASTASGPNPRAVSTQLAPASAVSTAFPSAQRTSAAPALNATRDETEPEVPQGVDVRPLELVTSEAWSGLRNHTWTGPPDDHVSPVSVLRKVDTRQSD